MEACRIRGAGVLLPVSALPSPYGIGTLGNEAYRFIDQLHAAGQTYWQVLPIGPTRVWKQSLPVLFRVCGKSLFH